ncbi:hypothetical protein ACIP5Y_21755 [Nocardia sp. NPDC088792]|uniref:hypothetical protein n=1 Tax=Nocardia sp. NPDC088792 TaxID=3364332 RepID=UPI00380F82BA
MSDKSMSLEIRTNDEAAFEHLLGVLKTVHSAALGGGCMSWLIVDGQPAEE